MKRLKKILALALAMTMVLAMTTAAWAEDAAPTKGSITVNSPVVAATYKVYKVFDMTTNAAVDAFSYTIDTNNPFYGAVVTYATNKDNGLILTRIEGSNPATYNVSVSAKDGEPAGYKKFDAQKFGKAMQAALKDGSPAITADATTGIEAKAAVAATAVDNPVATDTVVTNPAASDTSDQLTFNNLPLGYFLINPTYPTASAVTVTMGSDEDNNKTVFTDDDFVKVDGKVKEPRELVKDANENTENGKIVAYANATVTEDYVDKYIEDHGITTNKDGSPLNAAGKQEYMDDLKAAIKADAEAKVLAAFNNNGSEADINVKEPILVFLDSSQPDAVINEKNELDKWDIPVNPSGETEPGTPDHGEPEGGKNIIVQEANPEKQTPAYSADWSEAEIGESVHYQLRVNAMNFIRTGNTDKDIQQVKEYFLTDYQSGHMKFDETKGLHVSVWQGDNSNDSQAVTGTKNVTKNADGSVALNGYLDYTDYATGKNGKTAVFFKNNTDKDADPAPTDVFKDGTGIMVPWVKVVDPAADNLTEAQLNSLKEQFPIYTITNVPVAGEFETEEFKDGDPDTDGIQPIPVKEVNESGAWVAVPGQYVSVNNRVVNGSKQVLDENGNPIQKTNPVYTFSLYNSDVTIVVDYWMILENNAVVDEPGNKNYAQYGWSPVDNEDDQHNPKTPTNPKDDDKPGKKETVDEATVYTFAIAWVKVDEQGKALKDAEFTLPFYVKAETKTVDGKEVVTPLKDKDGAYIFAFSLKDEDGKIQTDTKGKPVQVTDATYPEDKSQPANADGTYPKFSAANTTNVIITDETGVITIKGLEQSKEGEYSITETKAPAGYNRLTAPFVVEAKKSGASVTTKTKTTIYLDSNGNVTDTVTTATEEYTTDNDSNVTNVPVYQFDPIVNKQGTELPSTGGIGTTIFYVVGAILVIGAGVVLITKRRMDA